MNQLFSKTYQQIKSKIPVSLKKIPWYLFKSPQREIGYYTIWIEFWGSIVGFYYSIYQFIFKPQLKPVSICTGLKNRSSNYLNIVLESVLKMDHPELIEISVFDCASDDIVLLEELIRKKWKGKMTFSSQNVAFNRSFAFNRAIEQSKHPIVFVSDADMSLPSNLVLLCNRFVFAKNVWFPICFHLNADKSPNYANENGTWYPVGKGMFAANKSDLINIGMYSETFTQWGGEDWELWLRFYKYGFYPFRNKQRGLFHHYHHSLKPENFVPLQ